MCLKILHSFGNLKDITILIDKLWYILWQPCLENDDTAMKARILRSFYDVQIPSRTTFC